MHTAAMINEISKKILNVIAEEHGFDLASLRPGEAYRLEGFLDSLERGRYPAFSQLDSKVFAAAQLTCRLELQNAKQRAGLKL